MLRYSTNNIETLPNEILIEIFDYLNPKELAFCSQVNKRWHFLTSNDEIWRKKFRKYHINLPLKSNISLKNEYLKRSKDYLSCYLIKNINSRRIHHLFPSFDDIRKLNLSIIGDIVDSKEKLLLKHGRLVDVINLNAVVGICINYQTKIDLGIFPNINDIEGFILNLTIPALIKKLIPAKETIRIHLKMYTIDVGRKLKSIKNRECKCRESFLKCNPSKSENLIEWHICIPQFLIGLWANDKSFAYFSYYISIHDIQKNLEKFVCNNDKKKTIDLSNLKKPKEKIEDTKFNTTKSEYDLKCMLSIENIEPSKSLLLNVWRSLDYSKGLSITLVEKSDQHSHLKLFDCFEFKPKIGHLHLKIQNLIKIELNLVTSRNDPLWSYSSCVILTPLNSRNVDYSYTKQELVFEDSVIKGILTKNEYGDLYLTEFIIL